MSDHSKTELMTPGEVASHLKVSVGTIYYWVSRREIPFIRVGRHLRFQLANVIESFALKSDDSMFTCDLRSRQVSRHPLRSLKTKDMNRADLHKKE
jgi:excisionase family DNA binding protein